MSLNQDLLAILCCPETKQDLKQLREVEIVKINQAISEGKLKKRGGEPITETIEGGLLRADGKYLYPIRNDIPIMLIDESIDMASENA